MRDRANRFWLGVIVFGVVALVLACGALVARAHDREHPELDHWYMGLENKRHIPCCDGSEAQHIADVDWDSRDGHYRVRLDGKWIDVPEEAVIDAPNLDGRTLVWAFKYNGIDFGDDADTGWHIRCFMVGAGG